MHSSPAGLAKAPNLYGPRQTKDLPTFLGRKASSTKRAALRPSVVLLTPKVLARVSARPTHRKSLPTVWHSIPPVEIRLLVW